MKPIEVRFSNLRSYRGVEPAVVNFGGKRLLGILGDTGAGKSSVIEAIVAALYSGTTWDGKNVGALLADGSKEMRVELDFEAAGRTWNVTRVIKAKGAAVHTLVEVGTTNRWDGAHDVNDQIVKLLGLSLKQFLQAVVLPQGKFDTLLKATPTERTKALESILGMEQLSQVRDQARDAADALRPPLEALRLRRNGMWGDPAARAGELRSALETLNERASALEAAASAVRETDGVIEVQEGEQRRFDALAGAVTVSDVAAHVVRMSVLADDDRRHQQILGPLADAVIEAKVARDRFEGATRLAAAEGGDRSSIAWAQQSLGMLAVALETLDAQRRRVEESESELKEASTAAEQASSVLKRTKPAKLRRWAKPTAWNPLPPMPGEASKTRPHI